MEKLKQSWKTKWYWYRRCWSYKAYCKWDKCHRESLTNDITRDNEKRRKLHAKKQAEARNNSQGGL